ncbi:unnamed protein product [Polarella glacialis]|uniref:Uncharacterized protein n=1 Tax=Polarella glacialis TaxID=89957 RepID=A0A813JBA4_POLGL|nr:unnamed protein product [Polarella glacialis]
MAAFLAGQPPVPCGAPGLEARLRAVSAPQLKPGRAGCQSAWSSYSIVGDRRQFSPIAAAGAVGCCLAVCARRQPARSLRRARRKLASASASSGAELSTERPWEAPGYRGAEVSALAEGMQAAVVVGIAAALAACTYISCATLGAAVSTVLPAIATSVGAAVLGLVYVAGGAAHFAIHKDYCNIMPHKGAWGFWNLPGTPSFHVNWTGVAEILGGVGVALGGVGVALEGFGVALGLPPQLAEFAAWALFLLTALITPANVYSATHNAPGPGPPPKDGQLTPVVPLSSQLVRFVLQVLLLTALWEIAHPRE